MFPRVLCCSAKLEFSGDALAGNTHALWGEIFIALPVCGTRQKLRLTKQARFPPTAAHAYAPLHLPPAARGQRGPPGNVTAPINWNLAVQITTAPMPPLCKGRWVAVRRLGGIVRYNVAKIAAFRRKYTAVTIPQSASLTAPLTQGSLGAAGIVTPLNSNLSEQYGTGRPRCPALPVADEAGHKRMQRSAENEPASSGEVFAGYRKRAGQ